MAEEPAVLTRGLTKRYGPTTALSSLDLEVPRGTIFGFLGPNGAGKSTTIRTLLGLIRPTAGSATVLGLDVVAERDAVHRRTGYLPGSFAADRGLTARDYLAYVARLRGGVDPGRVDHLAERFGLDLGRRIGTLSHGNRQKVGIVQAVMHEPDLLVLDEPSQGLDPLVQRTFLEVLREQRQQGRTVLLCSHVLSEVEEVADHVAILRDGQLVTVAEVAELESQAQRRLTLVFADATTAPLAALRAVPNVVGAEVVDGAVEVLVEGSMADALRTAAPHGIERVISRELDLTAELLQHYRPGAERGAAS